MLAVNNKRDNICKTLSECSKNSTRDEYFHKVHFTNVLSFTCTEDYSSPSMVKLRQENFKLRREASQTKQGDKSKFLPEVNKLNPIPSQTLMMITYDSIFSFSTMPSYILQATITRD